ncbi:unnamed protein product [Thelazia callipaeda]|uniref:Uncharacterized protein n=1 Tax=Thelazia callipaeda TaxID=103827 RepID=A0A0N5DAT1_THECL|nr:unnamed protein product [Thelazia callipaeda]
MVDNEAKGTASLGKKSSNRNSPNSTARKASSNISDQPDHLTEASLISQPLKMLPVINSDDHSSLEQIKTDEKKNIAQKSSATKRVPSQRGTKSRSRGRTPPRTVKKAKTKSVIETKSDDNLFKEIKHRAVHHMTDGDLISEKNSNAESDFSSIDFGVLSTETLKKYRGEKLFFLNREELRKQFSCFLIFPPAFNGCLLYGHSLQVAGIFRWRCHDEHRME